MLARNTHSEARFTPSRAKSSLNVAGPSLPRNSTPRHRSTKKSALGDIVAETDIRVQAVQRLDGELAIEKAARLAASGVQSQNSGSNAIAIANEVTRAADAEGVLSQSIYDETSSRTLGLIQLNDSLGGESARAIAAEGLIFDELARVDGLRNSGDIEQKTHTDNAFIRADDRAFEAERLLSLRIDNVLSNITPSAIDSFTEVVTALNAAGGDLSTAIAAEQSARQTGMATLQAEVDEMKAMLLALQAGY